MIGKIGERGSGISVLVARHDDDDDKRKMEASIVTRPIHYSKPYSNFCSIGKSKFYKQGRFPTNQKDM